MSEEILKAEIALFAQVISSMEPDAEIRHSIPRKPDGCYFIDVIVGDLHIVVQQLGGQWGISKLTEENADDFTHKPEEVFSTWKQACAQTIFYMYVHRQDKLFKETGDAFLDEPMIKMREKLIEWLVVRGNHDMLARIEDPNKIIYIETGVGWYRMLGDMIDKMANEMKTVEAKDYRIRISTIKEKFGSLRVYYSIRHKKAVKSSYSAHETTCSEGLHLAVDSHARAAEVASRSICEDCGEPGRLRGGSWIQTLCDFHSELKKKEPIDPVQEAIFTGNTAFLEGLLAKQKEKENDKLRVRRDGSEEDGTAGTEEGADARAE